MQDAALDNPFWSALTSRHRNVAQCAGRVRRYPTEIAPFLGVAAADVDVAGALELVPPGDTAYLLGVLPDFGVEWSVQPYRPLAQLVCESPLVVPDGPEIIELGEAHRADVLALTAQVYPHYFRPRTMALGRYFGMYVEGRLAAMIGERLGTDTAQELSAICTHPDFLGRGHARRLTAKVANATLARGHLPFLHVSYENTRAKALYEQMGFRLRRDLGFWSLRRATGRSSQ
jgi:ribosomal protein S18 acetylase RimI-like enzyme